MKTVFKTLFVLFALLSSAALATAQSMNVESFRIDPNDMDARVNAPVTDQNGDKCALIKIETTEKGFGFDVGQLGVSKVDENQLAETWVYIPHGAMRMRIQHASLGSITYEFPMAIREATVYRLKLTSDKVRTIVEETAGGQYFILTVQPSDANAQLIIDNNPPQLITDGELGVFLPYGEHTYRVESSFYKTAQGTVSIASEAVQKSLTLAPNFGYLHLNSTPQGAEVRVNNFRVGTTPYKSDKLSLGTYSVSLSMPNYREHQQTITLATGGETTRADVKLTSYLSDISISTSMPEAQIYINNAVRGTGSWRGTLLPGTYELRAERAAHRPTVQQLVVAASTPQRINLAPPTPMYGSLNVSSTPIGVSVSIDGKILGNAPDVFSEILAGEHTVTFEREGYATQTANITIEEGKVYTHRVTLPKITTGSLRVTTSQSGVGLWIDGKSYGNAIGNSLELLPGYKTIKLTKSGYETEERTVSIIVGELTVLNVDLKKTHQSREIKKPIETKIRASYRKLKEDYGYLIAEPNFGVVEFSEEGEYTAGGTVGGTVGWVADHGGYVRYLRGFSSADGYGSKFNYVLGGYIGRVGRSTYLSAGLGYGGLGRFKHVDEDKVFDIKGVAFEVGIRFRFLRNATFSYTINTINFKGYGVNLGLGLML